MIKHGGLPVYEEFGTITVIGLGMVIWWFSSRFFIKKFEIWFGSGHDFWGGAAGFVLMGLFIALMTSFSS